MTNGWFAFAVVTAILMCAGVVLAVAVMRAAWSQRERESLSASDLRAVEESALLLIDKLRQEADRSVSETERLTTELGKMVTLTEARIGELNSLLRACDARAAGPDRQAAPLRPANTDQILALASRGMDCVGIAKATGADCAEVNMALKLRSHPKS